MKSQELRLGNYIQTGLGIEIVIDVMCDSVNTDKGTRLYDEIDGVELSPELLEQCGFEKVRLDENNHEEGFYYTKDLNSELYCDLSFISGDKNGVFEVCLFPYEDFFRYKYLHQIQNVHSSLTGEELTVNLTEKVQ